eukprot:Em0636g1a
MTQTNCKANTQTFAQSSRATGNTPATIAPIALITTPPRIQILSSTVTVDVILCEESRTIFNSATVCLCSEDYSHMIPLLEQDHPAHLCHSNTSQAFQKPSTIVEDLQPSECSLVDRLLSLNWVALRTLGLAGFPDNYAPDSKSRLPVHNSLGNLLQVHGGLHRGTAEYKEAVKLGEDLNNLICLSWAHGNMGNAHLGLHQKDAALHHLKKALALTIEHETTPQAISRAYNNLGTAYQSLEDFKGAEDNFNLALNQAILVTMWLVKQGHEYSEVSKDRQVLSIANHNRGCAYLEWAEQLRSGQNGATSGISRNLQVLYNPDTMVPSPGFTPTELYRLGASDLTQAIELCNEVLQSTKGSMQGLSLSVSLIENSSRTFHKLQDCLIGLQQMDEALVVAEQCRARTLGERLLEKMGGGVNHLTPPLSLEQIRYIVKSQEHPTQATKVAVVTKLGPAQVIHIATHDILLLPSEVEQMNIKAALVVLSSCDSGRGMRIPDESAGMFMQFFYQYLVDGPGTTHALQKATLSVRCFRKYSQYTHWGGFQLIGRETYLHRTKTTEEALLAASLGPRCFVLSKQILLGYEGTELTDPVKTSIHSFYDYFRGGVFWISCRSKRWQQLVSRKLWSFHKLLCHICTHIIATLHAGNNTDLSSIVGQIDTLLIRGSNIIEVEPFSPIHTTQRIVYGHLQKTKCSSPSDEERAALEILVDFTKGSPPVIDIMTSKGMCTKYPESLDAFTHRLVFTLMKVNRFQMSLTNSQ